MDHEITGAEPARPLGIHRNGSMPLLRMPPAFKALSARTKSPANTSNDAPRADVAPVPPVPPVPSQVLSVPDTSRAPVLRSTQSSTLLRPSNNNKAAETGTPNQTDGQVPPEYLASDQLDRHSINNEGIDDQYEESLGGRSSVMDEYFEPEYEPSDGEKKKGSHHTSDSYASAFGTKGNGMSDAKNASGIEHEFDSGNKASAAHITEVGNVSDMGDPPAVQVSTSTDLATPVSAVSEETRLTMVRNSIELNTANPSNRSERDRYGFRKKTMFITQAEYDKWWEEYRRYLQRRKRKWVRLLKDNGIYPDDDQPIRFPARSEKLKRYIRKGIPAEYRGSAWFWYAKGHEILNSHPGLYDQLCKQTKNLKNNDTELIERDLHRTFPDNVHFRSDPVISSSDQASLDSAATPQQRDQILYHHQQQQQQHETPVIQSLRRVLTAFSVYQPKIGYCQSLNFIAGILLLFMDEEKTFWMLVIITQRYLPGVHEVNLEGVNIDQGVLLLCIKESLPHLWEKLGVNFDGTHSGDFLLKLPPITLCTASWFMSCFISILPTETMLRVWDCFFFEDAKIFFRIALTILKLAEPDIMKIGDQMEMFQVLQNYPKRLLDPSILMETCFKRRNGFGHISQDEITRLRQFVSERRKTGANSNMNDIEAFNKFKPSSIGAHTILNGPFSRRMRHSFRAHTKSSVTSTITTTSTTTTTSASQVKQTNI